jgi:hypothetical protein
MPKIGEEKKVGRLVDILKSSTVLYQTFLH